MGEPATTLASLYAARDQVRDSMVDVPSPLSTWYLESVVGIDDPASAIVNGKNDLGADALYLSPDDESTVIVEQFKERETARTSPEGPDDIAAFVQRASHFRNPAFLRAVLDGTTPARPALVERIRDLEMVRRVEDGADVELRYTSFGCVGDKARADAVASGVVVQDLLDLEKELLNASRDLTPGVPHGTLIFKSTPACHQDRVWLGMVSAKWLVTMYEDAEQAGHDIYEYNVRNALNSKINTEIRATLLDPAEHALFPAYNNGLTIVAGSVESLSSTPNQLRLCQFGVVNGGQTLGELRRVNELVKGGKHAGVDLDSVAVQVKVVAPAADEHIEELVELVAERSNRQNKIKSSDLASADKRQGEIARDLKNHDVLYLTKRSRALSAAEKRRWKRVVKKETAAKLFRAASQGRPEDCHQVEALFETGPDDVSTFAFPTADLLHLLQVYDIVEAILEDALGGSILGRQEQTRLVVLHLYSEFLRAQDSPLAPLAANELGLRPPLGGNRATDIDNESMHALVTRICTVLDFAYVNRVRRGEINADGTSAPPPLGDQEIDKYLFKRASAIAGARTTVLSQLLISPDIKPPHLRAGF